MMLFENNNENLPPVDPKTEEPDNEELANNIRAENQKNRTASPNIVKDPLHVMKKEPDTPMVDTSEDSTSKLGKFGWHETKGTVIPYLTRLPHTKLISKRMAEMKLLKGLESFFSWELLSCMHIDLIPATAAEAQLLNDINKNHVEHCYGTESFKEGDLLILMSDLNEMVAFLRYCCAVSINRLEIKQRPCGFMKINKETVPYVFVDDKMYLPLFYFDGDLKPLVEKAVEVSGWKVAYLKLLCKVQGIREAFFELPSIDCVDIHALRRIFAPGTSFQETWPSENKLVFRAPRPPPSNASNPMSDLDIQNPDLSDFLNTLYQPPNLPSPVELPRVSPLSLDAPKSVELDAAKISSVKSAIPAPSPGQISKPSPSSVKITKPSPSSVDIAKISTNTDKPKVVTPPMKALSASKTTQSSKNRPKIRPWSNGTSRLPGTITEPNGSAPKPLPSIFDKPQIAAWSQEISSRITPRTSRVYPPRRPPHSMSRMSQPQCYAPNTPMFAQPSEPADYLPSPFQRSEMSTANMPRMSPMHFPNPNRYPRFEPNGPPNVVISNRTSYEDTGSDTYCYPSRYDYSPPSYRSHFFSLLLTSSRQAHPTKGSSQQ